MDGVQIDPLERLLRIGPIDGHDGDWLDYRAEVGVRDEHVGALIGVACDRTLLDAASDQDAAWAPVHAWRALGQLRAQEAVEPLLTLMEWLDDDAADVDLPVVFGMIGPGAIPHIAAFIADRFNETSGVVNAITALKEIATRHPGCRSQCTAILSRVLQPHPEADPALNGFAVWSLIDLRAVEDIAIIRDAFHREAVDISIPGDLEDVEIALGLRECRVTPAPRYNVLPGLDSAGTPIRSERVGRNQPCPCGSGKKYKKCCLH